MKSLIVNGGVALVLALFSAGQAIAADLGALTPERLEELRKRYPEADLNKDGKLTVEEGMAYYTQRTKKSSPTTNSKLPKADFANVKYGPHARNVLDIWQAKSDKPTPLVVFIHGGGFRGGDKSGASADMIKACHENGVSYMSISYRFLPDAPVQDIMRDCARAIQFVRYKAKEYSIDPKRIASYGSSAGAGTSVWLAVHDDLADPKSEDPVLRESSRLTAAGSLNGQATYDLIEWEEKIGKFKADWSSDLEAQAFYHLKSREEVDGEKGQKIRADVSMLKLVSKGDAPVFIYCANEGGEPKDRNHLLHHPKHATVLKEYCDKAGVSAEMFLIKAEPKTTGNYSEAMRKFFFKHLGVETKVAKGE
ncbi:MAG TPA: alpha/beta hydrolase [Verrucomicrobiae bacterium]